VKQVVMRKGTLQVVDVPAPSSAPGYVLVATGASAISSGTELAAVSATSGSLAARAIRNPRLVLRTLQHAREHGVRETAGAVRSAVDADLPLGYSCAGTVLDTGGVAEFHVGQRVACAGAGLANHAELVCVPANLVAAVPDQVPLTDAAFATVGAIALHAVRRSRAEIGERVVVLGLGLLGLLAVQILRAAGVRVAGVEPVAERRELARELGAEAVFAPDGAVDAVLSWTDRAGADAVLVVASSSSEQLLNDAVAMLRRKGRLVPVGDVPLSVDRTALYEREADLLISTSYGPGRYDPTYEHAGLDYPAPYVRWTAGRNMDAFLRLLADGFVRVEPMAGLELPVERAPEAYDALGADGAPPAAVLVYDPAPSARRAAARPAPVVPGKASGELTVAIVGAGSFTRGTHVPNLLRVQDVRVKTVVSRRGSSAAALARSLHGAMPETDPAVAIEDPEIDLVLVATRHDSHAELAAAALRAGKAVFLEKPLGLTRDEIDDVWQAGGPDARLVIGFNRRLAPLAELLEGQVRSASGPVHLLYRVSAPVDKEHWLNDPIEGGGRILGEACHMLDLANWLCGRPERVVAAALPPPAGVLAPESATLTLQYGDGSVAAIAYSGVGSPAMPKERVEVFRGGWAWVLDDFATLTTHAPSGERTLESSAQDKGHVRLLERALLAARGRAPFDPGLEAAYLAQSAALAAHEALASGGAADVPGPAGGWNPEG
jgi:predicted dehydrogenase/NADPH:quinone reductase-like Zn-dependent oxidoreductase